jgi:hypothetical protein
MTADYVWKESYQAGTVETDDKKLQYRIQTAQVAIVNRLHDLRVDHGGTPEERQATTDALVELNRLNLLRREFQIRLTKRGRALDDKMQ